MRIAILLFVVALLVVVSVGLPSYYLSNGGYPSPSRSGAAPSPLYVWARPSFHGSFAGGIAHAVVIRIPALPNGTGTVYVDGSLGMVSWILLTNGLFNRSGSCANSFAPDGACSVYVGIWSPGAWRAYSSGGVSAPLWCYPGLGGGCLNVTGGEFDTPNLSAFDGAPWEIVLWNSNTYRLSGTYVFTVYSSSSPE